MPGPTDERPVSLGEILTAADARDLGGLVGRLAHHHNWEALTFLFKVAGRADRRSRIGLPELATAAQSFHDVVQAQRRGRPPAAAVDPDLRTALLAAGEALLALLRRPLEGDSDRRTARLGAVLLFDSAEFRRAASLFEELGDDARAADAFAALGDLDRMEAALARIDAVQRTRRSAVDAMRRFEALLGAGQRAAAVASAASIQEGTAEAASAHQAARDIDARLCRGRGVTMRLADGSLLRFAAVPALLGRDPGVEVPLRDPGVSRRHAVIHLRDGELVIEDAGSRAGIGLAGARLSTALPLRGEGELDLGPTCRLAFHLDGPGLVVLRGKAGLDRQLAAVVGPGALRLDRLLPRAAGVWMDFSSGLARLSWTPEVSARVGGQFVGPTCDLLHGDQIELRFAGDDPTAAPLRLEIP